MKHEAITLRGEGLAHKLGLQQQQESLENLWSTRNKIKQKLIFIKNVAGNFKMFLE